MGIGCYDSSTGRFLTRDPIKDGRNWYVYCENDPINFADQLGLAKIFVGWRLVNGIAMHVYIVILDEGTGQTWTIGGGPTHENGTGTLDDKSGPGGDRNYEGIGHGAPSAGNHRLIKDDDRPGKWWFDKLQGIGREVESKGLKYGAGDQCAVISNFLPIVGPVASGYLSGSNSNAFVSTVIQRGGLMDETRMGSLPLDGWAGSANYHWAPGWGRIIPR